MPSKQKQTQCSNVKDLVLMILISCPGHFLILHFLKKETSTASAALSRFMTDRHFNAVIQWLNIKLIMNCLINNGCFARLNIFRTGTRAKYSIILPKNIFYISLLIIPCIIYHVTNKETLNLENRAETTAKIKCTKAK